jgi:phenylalanyl-tRNA synthetase beta chain
MKVSYNWLKEYVDTNLSAEELGRILTDTGLEVESVDKIEALKGGLEGVVVGEVLSCEKHPDADKLKVTTVNVGTGDTLQIVCGAPNVAKGQKVAVALVGTTLYPKPEEGFKIKVSKIRGVESHGMLCAEDELGIGSSHEGIMVLDPSLTPGTAMAKVLELEDDYELEIGLTPNRADAMGHVGVARDIAAFLNFHETTSLKVNVPSVADFQVTSELYISISVEDTERCPRYTGTTIKNVNVKPSPAWLQKQLRAVGLSPINNVVDVTNYVMRELGTPLHAFDTRSLNSKIVVKTANEGDKFITLDGVERTLRSSDLMITNGNEHLCIAGVFGGLESGIKEDTTDVFLESAYFDPVSVRKTARGHGLHTDASFRFERGVDPDLTIIALKRAALLIQQVAGGEIAMEPVDHYPVAFSGHQVLFHFDKCNRVIGNELKREDVVNILTSLDITVKEDHGNEVLLHVPAYRVDVTREADVIEEVLRIYGFNNVELPAKLNTSIGSFPDPDPEKIQDVISEMLVGRGFSEMMNNSLTASQYAVKHGKGSVREEWNVELLNPLSQELDVMRQTLIFGALQVVEHNQNRQNADLKVFEFGKVYHKYANGNQENKRLILVLSGSKESENWNATKGNVGFYDAKQVVITILQRLGLTDFLKETALEDTLLEDGVQFSILKRKIGEIGWIAQDLKKGFGLRNDVFVADLDWDALLDSLKLVKVKYKELPKTFAVRRDFSLLLNKSVAFSEIESLARGCEKKLLQQVGLFDVYEGKNLEEGKKSYAVSFTFQDPEVTLKDQQIDAIMDKIRKELETKLEAQLR